MFHNKVIILKDKVWQFWGEFETFSLNLDLNLDFISDNRRKCHVL